MTVRVRFAPSPTGNIHIGNVRAALFNWLFANKEGGTFILRLEDTDLERSTKESAAGIIEDLRWLGLEWGEGPEVGGPHEPYNQMGRLARYKEAAEKLLADGNAYLCFCGKKEEAQREEEQQEAPDESGETGPTGCPCKEIDPEEAISRRDGGEPAALRIRADGVQKTFTDLVFGEVTKEVPDFIAMKSNGIPTYHLGVVVDDHDMDVTHVIRGADHLSNTVNHILLYEYLGWEAPHHGHFGLTFGLSKRDESVSIRGLREKGFMPEAITNAALLLGWHPPDTEDEKVDALKAAKDFGVNQLKRANANFDREKFEFLAGRWFREADIHEVAQLSSSFLQEGLSINMDDVSPDRLAAIVEAARSHMICGADVVEHARPFFEEPSYDGVKEDLAMETAEVVIETLRDAFTELDVVDSEGFKAVADKVKEVSGAKGKGLWRPIRAALWAHAKGPEVPLVAAGLGKEGCINRLNRALEFIKAQ